MNRNAPIGGASSWLVRRNEPVSRAFRAEHEQHREDDSDVDRATHDRCRKEREHDRPAEVDRDDDPATIEPIGDPTRHDAEQQVRQLLCEQRKRDEQRIPGLRRHEERSGGERDAIADVRDERRGEQPAEAPAEAGGRDGLEDRNRGAHRAENSRTGP